MIQTLFAHAVCPTLVRRAGSSEGQGGPSIHPTVCGFSAHQAGRFLLVLANRCRTTLEPAKQLDWQTQGPVKRTIHFPWKPLTQLVKVVFHLCKTHPWRNPEKQVVSIRKLSLVLAIAESLLTSDGLWTSFQRQPSLLEEQR